MLDKINIIWKDRKRIIFGLPWSFTKYSLSENRIFIETGILNYEQNEVRLYRVLDLQLTRSFFQRLFGLGTIKVSSSDQSMKNFEIKNIKNSMEVKETLSRLVEEQRDAKRVVNREIMTGDEEICDECEN
jgi:uncharacterized membrane protein YdbT with pleckstrin-like domain